MIVIGTIWLQEFSARGEITSDIGMNARNVSSGSGRTTRSPSSMPRSVTMGIRFWRDGRNEDVSVCSVIVDLWAITWISMVTVH